MKKMSRKAFLAGGATAVAAAGACLCTKTGWATLTGVGATPEIAPDAYDVSEDKRITIRLDRVPELAQVGGSVKILDSSLDDSLIVARIAEGSDTRLTKDQRTTIQRLLKGDHRALIKGSWPSLWWGRMERRANRGNAPRTPDLWSKRAKPNMEDVVKWIEAFKSREVYPGAGFKAFKAEWKYTRLYMGLQSRLLVEQVLYEYGKPWSTLCTGFGPVRD